MTCPRCGVTNGPERSACVRCGGSLAAPPVRDDRPLPPVLPVTKRSELAMGRSHGGTGRPTPVPAEGPGEPGGDLYLLASERSTGQPPPPPGGGAPGQRELAHADVPGRVAIGLSGA